MVWLLPFGLQALLLGIDEWVFHRRRGLPVWERWGHPLDTLTVLLCVSVAVFAPPVSPWGEIYAGLAIFSSVFITKDEGVHTGRCSAQENWLHSVLFLLHPIVLALVAAIWMGWLAEIDRRWLAVELTLLVAVGGYQIFYWNVWRGKDQ